MSHMANDSNTDWDCHKATIFSLYVEKDLKLKDLIDIMAKEHGLKKNKSQFETQFNKWGISKYPKEAGWKEISLEIARRREAGKESDVLFNNRLIPKARVRRQIKRYGFASNLSRGTQASTSQAPRGIRIRTPIQENLALVPQHRNATPFSRDQMTESPFPRLEYRTPFLPVEIDDQDFSLDQHAILPDWMDAALFPQTEEIKFGPNRLTVDLPFLQLEAGLHYHVKHLFLPGNLQLPDMADTGSSFVSDAENNPALAPADPWNTPLMLEHYRAISDRCGDIQRGLSQALRSPSEVFKALLPKIALVGQLEGSSIYPKDAFGESIISRLLIFAVSNNFAGLEGLSMESIIDYFKHQRDNRLLDLVRYTLGPTSEAFTENLFHAAVETKDVPITALLLEKGLSVNEVVCNADGKKYTAIERAAKLQSIEMSRLLLREKADVNKTYSTDHEARGARGARGALQNAIEGYDRQSRPPLELLQMLLESGSEVTERTITSTIHSINDRDLVAVLVCFGPKASHLDWVSHGILEYAADFFDGEKATSIVKTVLHACSDSAHGYSAKMVERLQCALDAAARKGKRELVHFLLNSQVSMTAQTLSEAIKSGNRGLIWFLLEAGAEVDVLATKPLSRFVEPPGTPPTKPTTPLAQAIRLGDVDIMTILERKGAWNQIEEDSRYMAALEAASEVGQLSTVQRLLDTRPNLDGRALGSSVVTAIRAKHESIAHLLIDAGAFARINESQLEPYFSESVEAASGEGQAAIVQKLVAVGGDINGKLLSGALATAVGKGQEVIALILLEAGADVHPPRKKWGPALVFALRKRNAQLVRRILDAEVNLHYHTDKFSPPLVEASEWGDLSIIEELIATGADVDAVSRHGKTSLTVSVQRKDMRLLRFLLDAGADVNNPGSLGLVTSKTKFEEDDFDGPLTGLVITPLMAAAMNGDLEMIGYLLSVGAHSDDSLALYKSLSQPMSVTEKLLSAFSTAYPHGRRGYGCEALMVASERRNLPLVNVLLKAKVDAVTLVKSTSRQTPNLRRSALGFAIQLKHDEDLCLLKRLLQAVKDPNAVVECDSYATSTGSWYFPRKTALLAAIDANNVEKMQLLINAGAEINWPATNGVKRTPLQKAAEKGNLQMVQILLHHGAFVNAQPALKGGGTALQLAAIGGYVGIAELLVENGADINVPAAKIDGRTALEGAAEHGRIDMVTFLFKGGASIHGAYRQQYQRALQLAQKNSHKATLRQLETLANDAAQQYNQGTIPYH